MKTKRYIICHEKTNYANEKYTPPDKIPIGDDAISDPEYGWICSCGRWTKLAVDLVGKLTHEVIEME